MSSLSSIASSVDYAQQYQELTNRVLAEGHISAETVTASAQAELLVDVETAVLQQALEIEQSQSQHLIDLLA